MVAKQQTQMQEYLLKSKDAMIVAAIEDQKPVIELCNPTASNFLSLGSLYNDDTPLSLNSVDTPIFDIK